LTHSVKTKRIYSLLSRKGLRSLLTHKSVLIFGCAWIICSFVIILFASQEMIDDRQLLEGSSIASVLISQYTQLFWALMIMAVTYFLTRKRKITSLTERAPEKSIALKEVIWFIVYGITILAGGQIIGQMFHISGFGWHLHGSFYGSQHTISAVEVLLWSAYNFTFYVVVPYIYTRKKGYSHSALNLRSAHRKKDVLLILTILVIESIGQLSVQSHFFELTPYQMLTGGIASFFIHLLGTVLPAMFFIYCFLISRYMRLTGSVIVTTILGGLTYAGFHLFEYWTVYTSFETALVSVSFVFMQFVGPGMVKSYLTLKTGNAWVHALSYHAIAPHVLIDTPHIVKFLRL
jgi:hypothetical protein